MQEITAIERLKLIELEMLKLPQIDLPVRHYFSDGMYMRELFIPSGTLLTGHIHKTEHISIMGYGHLWVFENDIMRELLGYNVLPSSVGAKRLGYALEDSLWTTIHVNADNERNIEILENRYVDKADFFIANKRHEYLEGSIQ